ncbi:DUF5032 domain-containing protein [uncultured Parabacteroides sp.]|uniref:DUF5032 domain-containing protein n=1 Tax=uncultured Parabacteroides sp. TaxID=512312 RepID=UPI002804F98A|nr:DUF5032 domain-containing protein [uncultured Parabacteroides sp.]
MKKYAFLFMIMIIGLLSCGDDDKPVVPKLDKLSQVICSEGTDVIFFTYINYTSDDKIASIDFVKGNKIPFIYVDKMITMMNPEDGIERIEYNMQGSVIIDKSVKKDNPYNKEVYISDRYDYTYTGSSLIGASRIMKWPKEKGGYESQTFDKEETYSWENGNIILFTQDKKRIEYKYSTDLTPSNFPWRVIPSFRPVGFDIVSPVNLLYGNPSRNLPESATFYSLSEDDDTTASYKYHFTTTGDYITSMTIEEQIYSGEQAAEQHTYNYLFTYSK